MAIGTMTLELGLHGNQAYILAKCNALKLNHFATHKYIIIHLDKTTDIDFILGSQTTHTPPRRTGGLGIAFESCTIELHM